MGKELPDRVSNVGNGCVIFHSPQAIRAVVLTDIVDVNFLQFGDDISGELSWGVVPM